MIDVNAPRALRTCDRREEKKTFNIISSSNKIDIQLLFNNGNSDTKVKNNKKKRIRSKTTDGVMIQQKPRGRPSNQNKSLKNDDKLAMATSYKESVLLSSPINILNDTNDDSSVINCTTENIKSRKRVKSTSSVNSQSSNSNKYSENIISSSKITDSVQSRRPRGRPSNKSKNDDKLTTVTNFKESISLSSSINILNDTNDDSVINIKTEKTQNRKRVKSTSSMSSESSNKYDVAVSSSKTTNGTIARRPRGRPSNQRKNLKTEDKLTPTTNYNNESASLSSSIIIASETNDENSQSNSKAENKKSLKRIKSTSSVSSSNSNKISTKAKKKFKNLDSSSSTSKVNKTVLYSKPIRKSDVSETIIIKCSICNEVTVNNKKITVKCGDCANSYHLKCIDEPIKQYKGYVWLCRNCESSSDNSGDDDGEDEDVDVMKKSDDEQETVNSSKIMQKSITIAIDNDNNDSISFKKSKRKTKEEKIE